MRNLVQRSLRSDARLTGAYPNRRPKAMKCLRRACKARVVALKTENGKFASRAQVWGQRRRERGLESAPRLRPRGQVCLKGLGTAEYVPHASRCRLVKGSVPSVSALRNQLPKEQDLPRCLRHCQPPFHPSRKTGRVHGCGRQGRRRRFLRTRPDLPPGVARLLQTRPFLAACAQCHVSREVRPPKLSGLPLARSQGAAR